MLSRILFACVAFFSFAWVASGVAHAAGKVIPPGNEPVVLRMVGGGATLPGGMKLENVSIAGNAIHAHYVGPTAVDVELLLDPPLGESLPSTARFAVRCKPRVVELEAALLESIRKHEGELRLVGTADTKPPESSPPRQRRYGLAAEALWIVLAFSFIALLLVSAVALPRVRSLAREDLLAAGALFVAAMVVRAALPWGPLDFAEGARIVSLWSLAGWAPQGEFATSAVLFDGLMRLSIPPDLLLRVAGPLVGALTVVAVYALARLAGLEVLWAVLAGAILALFPAHAHYSTGTAISVTTTLLWALTWCLALRPAAGRGLACVALLVTLPLAVFVRPEGHLLAASLLPLAFSPRWSRVHRAAGLIVLAGLAVLHLALVRGGAAAPASGLGVIWLRQAALDGVTSNPWWIALAIPGLVLAPIERNVRVCALLALAIPGAVYLRFASDNNSVWGQWRYFATLLPWLCVGAAAGAAVLSRRMNPKRAAWVPALIAIACTAPLLWQLRWLRTPADSQREFHAVRDSASAMLGAHRSPVLLRNMTSATYSSLPAESHLLLALAASVGRLVEPEHPCTAVRAPTQVLDLEALLAECPDALTRDDVRIYLGMFRPAERLAVLAAKGLRLDPISVESHRTAPGLNAVNTSCPALPGLPRPTVVDSCTFETGWFRASRIAPAP